MSDYVTLLGAEQVQNAAITMRGAAEQMQRAADTISEAMRQHEAFLRDFLVDLQSALKP